MNDNNPLPGNNPGAPQSQPGSNPYQQGPQHWPEQAQGSAYAPPPHWAAYGQPWPGGLYGPGPYGPEPYGPDPYGPPPGVGTGPQQGPQQGPQADQPAQNSGLSALLRQLGESAGLGDLSKLFAFDDQEFLKGAMVGAAAVLLLTNESVRSSLMGGINQAMAVVKPDAEPNDSSPSNTAAKTPAEESQPDNNDDIGE